LSRLPTTAVSYECAAEHLLGTITAACEPQADFAEQVQAALRAALALFAAESDLARLLTAAPHPADEIAIRRHQRAKERYGAMFRRAAGADPNLQTNSLFLEPLLIGGISFQVSRRVLAGRADRLPQFLPGLLEFILTFYLDPPQVARNARAPAF
jgi:hypothetical protein